MNKKILSTILIPCFVVFPNTATSQNFVFETVSEQQIIENIIHQKQNELMAFEELLYKIEQERKEREREIEMLRKESVNFYIDDISIPSGITEHEMYNILQNTGMEDVAKHIVLAEKQYGINAIILAALVAEESGWGKSARATGPTKNMTGYAVNNNSSKGKTYAHRGDSVLDSAKLLQDYITPGGNYYVNGKSLYLVGRLYCAKLGYDSRLTSISKTLLKKHKQINFN